MILSAENIKQLQKLLQAIQNHPLLIEKQEAKRSGNHIWCCDWWYIEVLKFLINGERIYLLDKPPYRLRDNPLFSKEFVIQTGVNKLKMLDSLLSIINDADALYVCECGRGLDFLLASMIKNWSKYYCYDTNVYYRDFTVNYFQEQFCNKLEYNIANSGDIDFSAINDKFILIANNTKIGDERLNQIFNNKNIVSVIKNGKIVQSINEWQSNP